MRRQDEIRLLFPALQASCQKLLLSEIDACAQAFDAEDAHDFLWPLTAHASEPVRHQALVSLSLFLPRYVAARMGALAHEAGPWSAFKADGAQLAPAPDETTVVARDRLRSAAAEALAPLAGAVAARLGSLAGQMGDVARLGLSLLGSDAALNALLADARAHGGGFASLWAFAHGGGAKRDTAELVRLLERTGWRQPDAVLAAMPLPVEAMRTLAGSLRGRLDQLGIANLALAFARNGELDAVRDLVPLLEGASGWTQVFVLRALAFSRQAAALPIIRRIHASSRHAFVRQQAVRAAGSVPLQDAMEFCLERARNAAGPEAAQALESLVSLRCPADTLAAAASAHLSSPALRARVNALLAVVEPGAAQWPRSFTELLESSQPLARVEAAFCLGYWQSSRALKALALQAASDPHAAVRQQAIKSLSRYPTALVYPLLTHLLKTAKAEDAQTALRVLARVGGDAPGPVGELLARQVEDTQGARRAMFVRALGGHAALSGDEAGVPVLLSALRSEERTVCLAALESFKQLPEHLGGPVLAELARLRDSSDPEVRSAALVAGFLAGDVSAVDRLADHATADDARRSGAAVLAFCELVLLATEVVGLGHEGLSRALSSAPACHRATARPTQRFVPVLGEIPGGSIEEGEFRVINAAAAPPQPPQRPGEPGDAPDASGDVLERVQEQYRGGPAPRQELAGALAQASYIAVAESGDELHEQSWLERSLVGARQSALLLGAHPLLVLPPLLLVIACVWALASAQSLPARTAGAAPALTVVSVAGKATGGDRAALLTAGDVVAAGDDLRVGTGTAVALVTESGDRVSVGETSRLGVSLDRAGQLVLALAEGTVDLEVRTGRTVLVRWLDFEVLARAGRLALAAQGGRCTARLQEGTGRLLRPGGQTAELAKGQEITFP